MAYYSALLSRLYMTFCAEDCRTYRIALQVRWLGRILSDVIARLISVAFREPHGERPGLRSTRRRERALGYSEMVITEGGTTVWLAGQTATVDDK
jgi:hypothetical protein